ncbi:MAG: 6-bladed beta-propeller [Planctomycetota bacterium]|jgi:uncharacterized repeat protein (TIGR01451 family)
MNPKCIASVIVFALLILILAPSVRSETIVHEFGSFGSGPGQFIGMNGIAVDEDRLIYVTDPGNGRVQIFESDGTFVTEFGEPGSGDGQFSPPSAPDGIAVNNDLGRIYVADSSGDRIQVFNLSGVFQFKWGSTGSGNGQFNNPGQVALDVNGDVYICDSLNDRVQKFDADGNFIWTFGSNGSGTGQFNIVSGVAVDPLGNIYMSDSLNDRVQVFDRNRNHLFTFGSPGTGDGEFTRPSHLAVFGAIYVADTFNDRVQVFTLAGDFVDQFPSGISPEPYGLAVDRVGQIYMDRSFSVRVVTIDEDGDGLFDLWEMFGLDVDGDAVVDVDLPGFGADPTHKDLFLELDWMTGFEPTRATVQSVKEAFALAPLDAGGILNPDGLPGINLWIDTGGLTDANASEDGAGVGTCGDGIDNLPDGLTDADDPDCLVGDDLGGGNSMAATDIPSLNVDFYNAKSANFNSDRAMVFRYAISARHKDGFGGGWGEVGGNDFIEYNHDPGTIMHEFGHNLNLRHGGFNDHNCKPNFVSVMNYDNQFGIWLNGGGGQDLDGNGVPDGQIIDYSPPRNSAGRGVAPLSTLAEDDLDESTALDAADPDNQLIFVNDNGQKVRTGVNGGVDWSGDGDTNDSNISVNIDTSGTDGRPSDCTNANITQDPPGLVGSDDWSVISLGFRQFGDADDGAVNPDPTPDQTIEDFIILKRELNTTDLTICKTSDPEPVEVGDDSVYTIVVTNNGPNPAESVEMIDVLPPQVTYLSDTGGCVETPTGTLTCDLGRLARGESREVQITVGTAEVCEDGVPTTLSNWAGTENVTDGAGPDLNPDDNEVTLETAPVDTTPPVIACNAPPTIKPNDVPISFTATATDLCDDDLSVEITEFDCFKFTKKGKRIDKTESCVVDVDGDTITILDSGGVGDFIVWTVRAVDSSGNVTEQECMVEVVNPGKGKKP